MSWNFTFFTLTRNQKSSLSKSIPINNTCSKDQHENAPLAPVSLLRRMVILLPHIKTTVIIKGHEDKWFVKNNFLSYTL